jgi:hypothetical protein
MTYTCQKNRHLASQLTETKLSNLFLWKIVEKFLMNSTELYVNVHIRQPSLLIQLYV